MGYYKKISHPLLEHALTFLRSKNTGIENFRKWMKIATEILLIEATRELPVFIFEGESPLSPFKSYCIESLPHFVVILRAGLGMLDGALSLFPEAKVSFLGLARNEETLQPTAYLEKLPESFSGEPVIVLEPMIATGNSLDMALSKIEERNSLWTKVISVISSKAGLTKIVEKHDAAVFTAAVDEQLNENGFIVPGLGDAGDRLWDG